MKRLLLISICACSTPSNNGGPTGGTDPTDNTTMVAPSGPVEMPPTPEPTEAIASVGPAGGVLTLGKLRLSFPKGAVDATTEVNLQRTADLAPGYTMFSSMYVFSPEDLLLGSPLIVEMPFEADGATAKLYWTNGLEYQEIDGVVEGNIFAAVIDNLGHGFVGEKIPVIVVLTPPTAPMGVIAVAGDTEVDLVWQPVAGATSYKVTAATKAGGPYTTLDTKIVTSFNHARVDNGKTYYYVIKANNADGDSPPSSEVSAVPGPVGEPNNVQTMVSDGRISITWDPPEHAASHTQYIIYKTIEGAPSGPTAFTSTTATAQTVDTNVANGTEYQYYVQAIGPAPSGATSPISAPSDAAYPYALVPTGSFTEAYGAGCATGLVGATGVSGVVSATGVCTSCTYAVRWSAADGEASYYKVSVQLGSGDPKEGLVPLAFDPKNAFLCKFAYSEDPDDGEGARVTATVQTCYGPTGLSRCSPDGSSFIFNAFDDAMNDTCHSPPKGDTQCVTPTP